MAIKKELIQFTLQNTSDCAYNIPMMQNNNVVINATTEYAWQIDTVDLSCGTGTIVINGVTYNLTYESNSVISLVAALNDLGFGFFCFKACNTTTTTSTTTSTSTAAPTTTSTTTSTTTASGTTTSTTTSTTTDSGTTTSTTTSTTTEEPTTTSTTTSTTTEEPTTTSTTTSTTTEEPTTTSTTTSTTTEEPTTTSTTTSTTTASVVTTVNVAPIDSFTSPSFQISYRINSGAWVLLNDTIINTVCPTYTGVGNISTPVGATLELAVEYNSADIRFAASPSGGSPLCGASPTNCGKSTPWFITASGPTTQFIAIQIVSGNVVTC